MKIWKQLKLRVRKNLIHDKYLKTDVENRLLNIRSHYRRGYSKTIIKPMSSLSAVQIFDLICSYYNNKDLKQI